MASAGAATRGGLPELDALVEHLRGDIFARFMRRSQKAALLEWRDRTDPPGLAARFQRSAHEFYGFGQRTGRYTRAKHGLPDFVLSGRFRAMMARRTPKSKNSQQGSEIVTTLKFGGGPLNFLGRIGGVVGERRFRVPYQVTVRAFQRHLASGKTANVRSYRKNQIRTEVAYSRSSTSYDAEFGQFGKDARWINARVGEIFREIMRGAVLTKKGGLRSRYFEEVDDA